MTAIQTTLASRAATLAEIRDGERFALVTHEHPDGDALGSLVACVYVPTLMTAVYNQAKRSPCVLRFHIASEGGWDIGVTTGLLLAALVTWQGYSIGFGILISLAGAATVAVLLHRYYTRHNAETIDASLVHQPEEAL